MKSHLFETTTVLPLGQAETFAFFADAANLAEITPPELGFEILTPLPIAMREGTEIEYRLKLWGVPFRWKTRISLWEPDARFEDRQLRGPYALWHHTHTFLPVEGGTRMHDRVEYALPLAPLGELAHPVVRRQIERIFRFRERAIRRILLGEPPA